MCLVFLPRLSLASITFFSERVVQIMAIKTYPVTLSMDGVRVE